MCLFYCIVSVTNSSLLCKYLKDSVLAGFSFRHDLMDIVVIYFYGVYIVNKYFTYFLHLTFLYNQTLKVSKLGSWSVKIRLQSTSNRNIWRRRTRLAEGWMGQANKWQNGWVCYWVVWKKVTSLIWMQVHYLNVS